VPGPSPTLHSLEGAFWGQLPLPVAEIGLKLQPGSTRYVGDVMALSWAALLTALWIDVSARRAKGLVVDGSAIRRALDRASHGKVATLLHRMADPEVSWDLTTRDDAFAGVCRRQGLRDVRVRDAIEAVVAIRNRWAHHKLPAAEIDETADAMEQAVRKLLALHATLRAGRLVYVDRVERRETEDVYSAIALFGGLATPFRKGQFMPAPPGLPQGRVFLRKEDTGALVSLHPFIHFDKNAGDRCLLLTELRETSRGSEPAWMRVGEGKSYPTPASLTEEVLALFDANNSALPEDEPTAASAPPVRHEEPPWTAEAATSAPKQLAVEELAPSEAVSSVIARSSARPWAGRLATIIVVALCMSCVVLTAGAWLATNSSGAGAPVVALTENPPSRSAPPVCDVGPPQGRAMADLPAWLTGTDVRWGETTAAFDARCGAYRPTSNGCSISAGRILTPAHASGLPGISMATAAFDTRAMGGMFEVTVQSTAPPEQTEAAMVRAWGPPSSVRGPVRIWLVGDVRVTLAGARASLREAHGYRSTLVARFLPLSAPYYAFCPSP
jgi:hypothetical protein